VPAGVEPVAVEVDGGGAGGAWLAPFDGRVAEVGELQVWEAILQIDMAVDLSGWGPLTHRKPDATTIWRESGQYGNAQPALTA
jgi:hypothetical protein